MKKPHSQTRKIIRRLQLKPLAWEGGYFRQTYLASGRYRRGKNIRPLSTAIYYLVTDETFSAFHRVKNTEILHHYAGASVALFQISPKGKLTRTILGPDILKAEQPQVIVPRGCWQGLNIIPNGKFHWALLGATVTPGFHWKDFELGVRKALLRRYPRHAKAILSLTRLQGP